MDIKEALAELDIFNDDQWTADGAPKTDTVSEIMGKKVSRADITNAAPKFSRTNVDLEEVEPIAEVEEVEEVEETEDLDISILQQFADMEPMLPQELAEKVLKKIDARLLPEVELLLAQQMQALESKQSELDELKRKVKLGRSLTQTWIKQLIPDMSNQQAIQEYIRSSAAHRAEKAGQIQKILGGLKPSDIAKLDPRAPIDRAFARKTARGGARPVR